MVQKARELNAVIAPPNSNTSSQNGHGSFTVTTHSIPSATTQPTPHTHATRNTLCYRQHACLPSAYGYLTLLVVLLCLLGKCNLVVVITQSTTTRGASRVSTLMTPQDRTGLNCYDTELPGPCKPAPHAPTARPTLGRRNARVFPGSTANARLPVPTLGTAHTTVKT